MDICNTNIQIVNSQDVARYFLFLKREKDLNFGKLLFKNITAKRLYNDHKKIFDKFFDIATEYGIDIKNYITFFVIELSKTEKAIDSEFLNINTINFYCENLKIKDQYDKIYKYFLKSANNVASECIKLGLTDSREYIKRLILTNRLAAEYLSGKISRYYLAAINNIDKLISKTNSISKDEFADFLMKRDKLLRDIQDVFNVLKSKNVNSIQFTNDLIKQKLKTV